jgi:Sec-independent protein translocase protein TatA
MVIAVVAFVIFDGKKLPELCKELGEGLRGALVQIANPARIEW